MKKHELRLRGHIAALLVCLGVLSGNFDVFATENATLVSVLIPAGTQIMPRTMFTQTWTMRNTGSNSTWSPGQAGCTLNMVGKDSLGAITTFTNASASWYTPSAIIGSGKSVASNATASFSLVFIAPEAPGSYTDTFQLNGAAGTNFGPLVTVQIAVPNAGSTNQYDRSKAVSYANNYAGIVCSDGYFWTNSSNFFDYGVGSPVPTNLIGDDCAHFVSCCIGNQAAQRGGGINIRSRVTPTYGEPGAQSLIYTTLIAAGYAKEVSSLSQMSPGDLIGWNWEGKTNTGLIDHVTLYLGNGLIGAHATSHLDVSIPFYQAQEPGCVFHLIHILDAPTLTTAKVGKNLVLSWGTNWTGYALYSSPSLAANATWTKMTKSPTVISASNVMTNTMSTGTMFYRLVLP